MPSWFDLWNPSPLLKPHLANLLEHFNFWKEFDNVTLKNSEGDFLHVKDPTSLKPTHINTIFSSTTCLAVLYTVIGSQATCLAALWMVKLVKIPQMCWFCSIWGLKICWVHWYLTIQMILHGHAWELGFLWCCSPAYISLAFLCPNTSYAKHAIHFFQMGSN